MWKDPIVTETRQLREQYASQFAHNADAIFQDILRRQSMPGKILVAFQPRRPVLAPAATQPVIAPDTAHKVG
jgi:hypothetical protein